MQPGRIKHTSQALTGLELWPLQDHILESKKIDSLRRLPKMYFRRTVIFLRYQPTTVIISILFWGCFSFSNLILVHQVCQNGTCHFMVSMKT